MKKIVIAVLAVFAAAVLSAQETAAPATVTTAPAAVAEPSSPSSTEIPAAPAQVSGEKETGLSIGFRLSVLGFQPTASVIIHNAELEAFFPMIRGEDGFGVAYGGSIGYVSNPFKKGWENGVGLSYLWISPSYCKTSIFRDALSDNTAVTENGGHIVSIYYRGTVKFNEVIGLTFKTNLPVVMSFPGNGAYSTYTIIDADMGWLCWLMIPCTFSIGMRFEM